MQKACVIEKNDESLGNLSMTYKSCSSIDMSAIAINTSDYSSIVIKTIKQATSSIVIFYGFYRNKNTFL